MPLVLQNYIIFCVIFILLSWAVYLPYRCGQLYLAPVYCMATGAYFAAYATTVWNWPISLAILSSSLVGAFFAFVPAIGLRRAPGFAVAIATLALVFILQTVIRNLAFLGGQAGYFGIPPMEQPLITSLTVLALSGLFVYRIDHSRIGRSAEAIYYSREEVACFGVDIDRIGMFLQVASGAISGVAGALFAFTVGCIFPALFGFSILQMIFPVVFVGGNFTMWGTVVFAPILWGIPIILPSIMAEWKDVIYGTLLIAILILRPEGVISKQVVRSLSDNVTRWITRCVSRELLKGGERP
jgi:branched-chain amino acid transport system permease protein